MECRPASTRIIIRQHAWGKCPNSKNHVKPKDNLQQEKKTM